ncbi:unnamed protein product, partial [Brenthis ino]
MQGVIMNKVSADNVTVHRPKRYAPGTLSSLLGTRPALVGRLRRAIWVAAAPALAARAAGAGGRREAGAAYRSAQSRPGRGPSPCSPSLARRRPRARPCRARAAASAAWPASRPPPPSRGQERAAPVSTVGVDSVAPAASSPRRSARLKRPHCDPVTRHPREGGSAWRPAADETAGEAARCACLHNGRAATDIAAAVNSTRR